VRSTEAGYYTEEARIHAASIDKEMTKVVFYKLFGNNRNQVHQKVGTGLSAVGFSGLGGLTLSWVR